MCVPTYLQFVNGHPTILVRSTFSGYWNIFRMEAAGSSLIFSCKTRLFPFHFQTLTIIHMHHHHHQLQQHRDGCYYSRYNTWSWNTCTNFFVHHHPLLLPWTIITSWCVVWGNKEKNREIVIAAFCFRFLFKFAIRKKSRA